MTTKDIELLISTAVQENQQSLILFTLRNNPDFDVNFSDVMLLDAAINLLWVPLFDYLLSLPDLDVSNSDNYPLHILLNGYPQSKYSASPRTPQEQSTKDYMIRCLLLNEVVRAAPSFNDSLANWISNEGSRASYLINVLTND